MTTLRSAIACLLLLLTGCAVTQPATSSAPVVAPVPLSNAEAARRLEDVTGVERFDFETLGGRQITVWSYRPQTVRAQTPVLFVMHGVQRDGARYLLDWVDFGRRNNQIIVVPEFDAVNFPGSNAYNHGNFRGALGNFLPREQWSFSVIEPLFDAVRARTGTEVDRYRIYGHSAGAQFVHRFVLFMPEARYSLAVSANAGSYAVPDLSISYPFGLKDTPLSEADLVRALQRPLTILLGTADNDPAHPNLPDQPGAVAQGPHRVARGEHFFAAARRAALGRNVRLRWQLGYAEGIAHDNAGMARNAERLLDGRP